MKFKKSVKGIVLFPVLLFLATFIYGMLKLDISGMDEGIPYGLIYAYILQGYVFIAYILSFILNVVVAVSFIRKLRKTSELLQFWLSMYVVSFLLLLTISFTIGYPAMFPYTSLSAPGTIGVGITAVFLAVSGWRVVDLSTGELGTPPSKMKGKAVLYGVLLPITVITVTVGGRLGMIAYETNDKNEIYEQVIERRLQAAGTEGAVKAIESYGSENRVQLDYTLTQGNVEVYGKGFLTREDEKSDWVLEDSSMTTYEKSVPTILQVPAHSQEAKDFLVAFKQVVEQAIIDCGLEEEIGIETPVEKNDIRTAYDSPYLSIVEGELSEKIEKLAQENAVAADSNKSAFGGYAALTIEQLMTTKTIMATMPIQYPFKDDHEFDEREENIEKFYEALGESIDFSGLSDGYYAIAIGKGVDELVLVVENHQVTEYTTPFGRRMLEDPKENLGSYTSSDYMEW
ncbi:hypothetical protein [uncultured Enterococcus sp.]|uniref:hypothetical protein n=1 Tax=uncultured Enterococcus sp. TaxID=167972 RepID=UPI002AA804DD|nr:hypothetical protein [uncultured Enterococcus sp.]